MINCNKNLNIISFSFFSFYVQKKAELVMRPDSFVCSFFTRRTKKLSHPCFPALNIDFLNYLNVAYLV